MTALTHTLFLAAGLFALFVIVRTLRASDRCVEALRLGAGSDGASVEQHGGKALHGAGLSTPAEVASRECNRSAGQ